MRVVLHWKYYPQTSLVSDSVQNQECAVLIYRLCRGSDHWMLESRYLLLCHTCLFRRYCMEFYKLMLILASSSDANFFIVQNITLWYLAMENRFLKCFVFIIPCSYSVIFFRQLDSNQCCLFPEAQQWHSPIWFYLKAPYANILDY